jgi:hypothetical protein
MGRRCKSRGGESTEAWRTVLDDLIERGLRRPEFLIVDGAPRLDEKPIDRLARCPGATLHVQAPQPIAACARMPARGNQRRLHRDIVYSVTPRKIETPRKTFIRKWRLKHQVPGRPVLDVSAYLGARCQRLLIPFPPAHSIAGGQVSKCRHERLMPSRIWMLISRLIVSRFGKVGAS